jgi:hypothetical protein
VSNEEVVPLGCDGEFVEEEPAILNVKLINANFEVVDAVIAATEAEEEDIEAITADQDVIAFTAINLVMAITTNDAISAGITMQLIIAVAAVDPVIACTAKGCVSTVATSDAICASTAINGKTSGTPSQTTSASLHTRSFGLWCERGIRDIKKSVT